MVVHFVGEAGVAALIGSRHLREIHARGVREDEPLPCDLDALLTISGGVLVYADEAAALRDEQVFSGGAVEDVLTDLGEDRSRQVRVDPADENGGNHASRHHRVRRCGRVKRYGLISGIARR